MKQTGYTAFLLTMLSLLLITVAAVFFLFQGRRTLRAEADAMRAQVNGLEASIVEMQSTAAARAMVLATSEAEQATLQTVVAAQETALAQRQATLVAIEQTREAATASAAAQPPTVLIVRPEQGDLVENGEALLVVVITRHPLGVSELQLQLGDETVSLPGNDDSFRIFRHEYEGPPLQPGTLLVSATAKAVNGMEAEDSVRITVSEPPPTPDAAP